MNSKSWLQKLKQVTPLQVASILCIAGIIYCLIRIKSTDGWSYLVAIYLLPPLLIFIGSHIIIRLLVRKNRLLQILIEFILIVIISISYISYYR